MKRIALEECRQFSRHRGSILLMVLVAIILMTLTTSTYLLLMRNEHLAARYSGNHLQTEMLTQSGIDYLRVFLAQTTNEIEQQGGLFDNPDTLQDVLVIDEKLANYRGRFTVVAPDMEQGYYQDLRYGLENESAKLNLNALLDDSTDSEDTTTSTGDNGDDSGEETEEETLSPSERLLLIPGMNEEVVDAILDWLDEDDTPRDFGAESDFYLGLTSAYQPTNGPLAHLDDLLMIQGVTPELLYGVDANQNYRVDADEQPRGALEQLDNTRGELDRGWSAYLTVHSLEKNVTPEGEEKIDLNAEDLQTLHGELSQALGVAEANFIVAYRQYGPAGEPAGETTSGEAASAEAVQIDFEKEGGTSIDSLLELIGAQVSIENEENEGEENGNVEEAGGDDDEEEEDNNEEKQAAQLIESPWQDEASTYSQGFADLLDVATVDSGERIAGRININLASLPVLLTIPGMTETLADQILGSRISEGDFASGEQRHTTWLIAEGMVTLDELKPMFPWITTGGDVYSGQIVGYFDAGTARARARAEIVLDRSGTQEGKPARLLSWKDLGKLGPGFSRTVLSTLVEPDE